jgi:orotidine-5'-phosphate decarboxylase
MMTLHLSGGPAMLSAAIEEANAVSTERRPLLVGVSVLTSLDQTTLTNDLGVNRTIEEHMVMLSTSAVILGMDGVVCSPHEIKPIRQAIGKQGVIVTPGIRLGGVTHDQVRVGTPREALTDGADYLVIGRALSEAKDPEALLAELGA